jgi:hypothetical protein
LPQTVDAQYVGVGDLVGEPFDLGVVSRTRLMMVKRSPWSANGAGLETRVGE